MNDTHDKYYHLIIKKMPMNQENMANAWKNYKQL